MKHHGSRLLNILSVFLVALSFPAHAQQRRTTPKPIPKVDAPTQAAPTFETLLGDDSYKIYAEVRSVGQLIRSQSINELLEPITKLAAPPKEFKTLLKWLNTHADDVMSSRMLVAVWPTVKDVPDALVAIEFDSADAAAKFEQQLNSFLPKVMPTQAVKASLPGDKKISPTTNYSNSTEDTTAKPTYYLKQVGALILVTPTPLTLKNLRAAGSKLLTDNVNFRVAHNRFASEQFFVYVDIAGIELEEKNQRKQFAEEEKKRAEEEANQAAQNPKSPEAINDEDKEESKPDGSPQPSEVIALTAAAQDVPASKPDPLLNGLGSLANGFFGGQGKWPSAIGVGVNFESDSFDVRALMVTAAGEKCDAVPFIPNFIPAAPVIPSSPSILPADTELFASLSLDLPQMYAAMSKPVVLGVNETAQSKVTNGPTLIGPFAQIEKSLKIKVKDDLLPLLGSEIVISMPVKFLEAGVFPRSQQGAQPSATDNDQKTSHEPTFIVAISLKDKEGMSTLLPKIIDSIGFKGASTLGQTEKTDDTELVSYGNILSYAFIENFLIISADPAATRHVVECYLKHETLSSDTQFKNYTRWQPRQLQAQVYVSPAFMDSYKSWANQPSPLINDQTRDILSRLSLVGQPVTYSLSNDGLGTLHELHLPKNLVLMAVAGMASESNPSPIIANERGAMGALYMISSAETQYRQGEGQGNFGSLEQLMTTEMVSKELIENHGYKIQLNVSGNKFQITAVPTEYGTTGRTSYFLDETNVLRGSDHGGGAATVDDPPFQY